MLQFEMLMFVLGVLFSLLIAYIVYTLVTSSGSDLGSNSFDAFVDDTPCKGRR